MVLEHAIKNNLDEADEVWAWKGNEDYPADPKLRGVRCHLRPAAEQIFAHQNGNFHFGRIIPEGNGMATV